MKSLTTAGFVLVLFSATAAAQSGRSDLQAPQTRAGAIARAEAILTWREKLSDELPADLKNPFNPAEEAPVEAVQRVHTGKELIALLAAQLQPTGSAERDGEKFLLLGQRKVKVGERIPIAFENAQYEVELLSIDGGTFTIRRNNEEFTRPIKPGKNP